MIIILVPNAVTLKKDELQPVFFKVIHKKLQGYRLVNNLQQMRLVLPVIFHGTGAGYIYQNKRMPAADACYIPEKLVMAFNRYMLYYIKERNKIKYAGDRLVAHYISHTEKDILFLKVLPCKCH